MPDDYLYKHIVVPLAPFLSEGSDISRMRARLDELNRRRKGKEAPEG